MLELKKDAFIISLSLDSNKYSVISGNEEFFSNKETYDFGLSYCANKFILNQDKDDFIKKLNRSNLKSNLKKSVILVYPFRMYIDDSIKFCSVKILLTNKETNDCVLTFDYISKEEYIKLVNDRLLEIVASTKFNTYDDVFVFDFDTLALKLKYHKNSSLNFDDVESYSALVANILNLTESKTRTLQSLNMVQIKEVLRQTSNYNCTILLDEVNKNYIHLEFYYINNKNEKYLVIFLTNDKDKINEIMRREEIEHSQIKIARAMTLEYKSIFVVNFYSGLTSYYYVNKSNKFLSEILTNSKYSDAINIYVRNHVHIDDQERVYRLLNFENLKEKLEKQNHILIQFKRVSDDKIDHAIFSISRLCNDNYEDQIIIAIRSINQTAEQDLRQKDLLAKIVNNQRQFDGLTNIFNRQEFIRICAKKIATYTTECYLMIFDIDRFSVFNDLYGITSGDEILISIGDILVKLSDDYDITYARLSNDIYAVLLNGNLSQLNELVTKIKNEAKSLSDYFDLNLTFGAYKICNRTMSVETMLDYCKQASKTLKDKYVKTFALYDKKMSNDRIAEQKVINRMNQALINKEFQIYLQPKYDIYKNELVGAESLVRWIKGTEIIPPSRFVPIFEHNGFITKLDYYVWEETLKYLKWRKDNNLKLFPISVNVSRVFLALPNFKDIIVNLVDKYGIDHKYFELEIVETILSNVTLIKNKVNDLRSAGFKILMDDFGSGYSSLNVLKDVEFDVLKIDLKFFSNNSKKSQKIVETVINLSRELNIPAIAEGVETKEYIDLLKEYGCQYAQGYYYDKPMDLNTFNNKYNN